jgi:amicoumacin kinase
MEAASRPPAPLTPAALRSVLDLWRGEGATARRVDRSDHHLLYRFSSQGRELMLRLTQPAHRDRRHVEEEVAWVRHLAAHGVAVCAPVRSVQGRWVETVSHADEGPCVAVVTERARGRAVGAAGVGAWGAELFREWGRTAGRLHAASESFAPPSGFRRNVLDGRALSEHAARSLPATARRVADLVRSAWDELAALPVDPSCYGMIHGDLTPGNLRCDDGRLILFDCDDCGFAWFAYDLAIAVHSALYRLSRRADFRTEARSFFAHFISGYETEKPLGALWADKLPRFMGLYNSLAYVSLSRSPLAPECGGLFRFVTAHLGRDELFADCRRGPQSC